MVTVGEMAPEFTLEGSNGEQVRLADFRGKNVVLYFYPKDMTSQGVQLKRVISVILMYYFKRRTRLFLE